MLFFEIFWIVFGLLFSLVSFLPLVNSPKWIFRVFDFVRLQLWAVLLILLIISPYFLLQQFSIIHITTVVLIFLAIVYHSVIIIPYFPRRGKSKSGSRPVVTALSVNVKQENSEYSRLIQTIRRIDPDIVLTTETDETWERNIKEIEDTYPNVIRVPKSNRYGMHLYTKLHLRESKIHYLISEEHPSIEARLTDKSQREFIFWGIHPPPPSPTEKPTSRQKDAELMKMAKIASKNQDSLLISGDFNNVCWSKASRQFRKISGLEDARIKRGIYATFPAHLRLLRFPIDLLFHSRSVSVNKIQVLPSIGSDHLPLLFQFSINGKSESAKVLEDELENLADQKIEEGKKAAKEEN